MVFIEEIEDENAPTVEELKAQIAQTLREREDANKDLYITDQNFQNELQEARLGDDEEQYVDMEDMTIKVRKVNKDEKFKRTDEDDELHDVKKQEGSQDISFETPLDLRQAVRCGQFKFKPTSGLCPGYQQANLAFIPDEHFDDFVEFCENNPGPLPLLHKSKEKGDFNAEPLTSEFCDARTDVPGYEVYTDGSRGSMQKYLLPPARYENLRPFYLGCSFGFEYALQQNGVPVRNVEQKRNVSMYRSNVEMTPCGVFGGPMVVSMRYIPKEKLAVAASCTSPLPESHGAPIWIGSPKAIGIVNIEEPDYGDSVFAKDGDVPCFWACGVSAGSALNFAKLPLSATHAPGSMLVIDEGLSARENVDLRVVEYNPMEGHYSLLAAESADKIEMIEAAMCRDPGLRGIQHLIQPGDLQGAALALSHAKSVLITTGFPCNPGKFPYENDGPIGVAGLCVTLLRLGKKVTFLLDEQQVGQFTILLDELAEQDLISRPLPEILVPKEQDLYTSMKLLEQGEFDCFLACERAGAGDDGKYHKMSGEPMPTASIDRVEDLWYRALDLKIPTIAIGDGGNELGMGKVHDEVIGSIHNGDMIAASGSTMWLLSCGVSNWGCWALQHCLAVLEGDHVHQRYLSKGVSKYEDSMKEPSSLILTSSEQYRIMQVVGQLGYLDGISNKPDTCDNLPWEEHERTHSLMTEYTL